MRISLAIALIGVALYALYCMFMMAINRSKDSRSILWGFLWPAGLSDVGLRYFKRYFISVLLAAVLAILWFVFVEPI